MQQGRHVNGTWITRDAHEMAGAGQKRQTPMRAQERRLIDIWAERVDATPSPRFDNALRLHNEDITVMHAALNLDPPVLP